MNESVNQEKKKEPLPNHPNQKIHKFRESLLKNLIGTLFGWIFVIGFIAVGIWDIVDPWILESEKNFVGIMLAIMGLLLLYIWPRYILKWDSEMVSDFIVYTFTSFLVLVIVAANIFMGEIINYIILKEWIIWVILGIGAAFLLFSILLVAHKDRKGNYRWNWGASFMILGNLFIIYATYLIAGRYLR